MSQLKIEGTPLLEKTLAVTSKVGVHEGGSSSSKTFSLAQAHLAWTFGAQGKTFSVVRKTMPAMKRGALKDFKEALGLCRGVEYFGENKTDLFFINRQTETKIEFFALDTAQKARGPRRDRLWVNEGNELTLDDWRQLSMRTREQIWIDYNPSMQRHWIYDEVLTRSDCTRIHSTYKDNLFLTPENIREIEILVPVYEEPDGTHVVDWMLTYKGRGRLIAGDPYQWAVFGLGQRGAPAEAIYPYVYECNRIPDGVDTVLGLDFGYTHAMSLTRVGRRDEFPSPDNPNGMPSLFVDELVHETHLTTDELIDRMVDASVSKKEQIYADPQQPGEIKKLRNAGYRVTGAKKEAGSVYSGVMWLKGHRLYFTARSQQAKGQFQDYRWKKRPDDTIDDEPVKLNDDAPDSVRYGSYSHWGRAQVRAAAVASMREGSKAGRKSSPWGASMR